MDLQVSADTFRAAEVLTGMAVASQDLNPFFLEVVSLLEDAARQRFVRDANGDWPPLDRDTIQRRLTRGITSTAVLEVSGRLRDSLTESHPDAVRVITDRRLQYGTRLAYAAYVANRRDPMPQMDQPILDEMAKTLIAHLTGDL